VRGAITPFPPHDFTAWCLTLNLLTTTIVAPPSNANQMADGI